jgi:hypothetical protein
VIQKGLEFFFHRIGCMIAADNNGGKVVGHFKTSSERDRRAG